MDTEFIFIAICFHIYTTNTFDVTLSTMNNNVIVNEMAEKFTINDDYKYPNSITPTKVENDLLTSFEYNVPFMYYDVLGNDIRLIHSEVRCKLVDSNYNSDTDISLTKMVSEVFSDFCKQIKEHLPNTINENTSLIESNLSVYAKKPPVNFIALQDYGRYMQFMREIMLLKSEDDELYPDNFWNESNRNDQIMRSLLAFYKLYQEYSFVCEKLVNKESKYFSSGDDQILKESQSNDQMCVASKVSEMSTQTEEILISVDSTETIKTTSTNSSIIDNIRSFFHPTFSLGRCIKTVSIKKKRKKKLKFRYF